jgi:hypothetical protein
LGEGISNFKKGLKSVDEPGGEGDAEPEDKKANR